MIQITRELLVDNWEACYSIERIEELVPPEGLTPLEVLETTVPAGDRLWVILREEIIPARELRLLACKWAREALTVAGSPDPRSVAAIDVAERFANGEATNEELAAVRDAAWDAARYASRYAAWAAAWCAARAVARDAAWYAAWYAARDAAWYAQIEDCKVVIRKLMNQ